ncbi:hypothetical protein [Cetobacterium ceti]
MELKYKFSKTSISRMKGVDPRLIILITSYLALGKKDIGVSYGARTEEEQILVKKKILKKDFYIINLNWNF